MLVHQVILLNHIHFARRNGTVDAWPPHPRCVLSKQGIDTKEGKIGNGFPIWTWDFFVLAQKIVLDTKMGFVKSFLLPLGRYFQDKERAVYKQTLNLKPLRRITLFVFGKEELSYEDKEEILNTIDHWKMCAWTFLKCKFVPIGWVDNAVINPSCCGAMTTTRLSVWT